jgi:mannose-1-phosphate guanylyltransferase/mannose-6-phosphate isomerase
LVTTVTPVIMVGGLGTRLWPTSRRHQPKQFQVLTGDLTMLQQAAQRVSVGVDGEIAFKPPVLICGETHSALAREQLRDGGFEIGALLLEPIGRSTGACAVVAAALAGAEDPESLILLLPSDHHVADDVGFRAAVAKAAPAAIEGHLVTFGAPATRPETGYGYILADGDGDVRPVQRFIEKPDAETAAAYVADGRFLWNSGMFLARADLLIEEMARFAPEILDNAREALARATPVDGGLRLDQASLSLCPAESLDRAVMERTARAAVTRSTSAGPTWAPSSAVARGRKRCGGQRRAWSGAAAQDHRLLCAQRRPPGGGAGRAGPGGGGRSGRGHGFHARPGAGREGRGGPPARPGTGRPALSVRTPGARRRRSSR